MSEFVWSRMALKEFVESGLLLQANRAVLWPLGLALTVRREDDGTYSDLYVQKIEPWGLIADSGDELAHERELALEEWLRIRFK